jgi:AAA family ATP:ADP antiporter
LVKQNFAARIQKGEWAFVVLMFFYFFAVITTFWILKPIKKALFIDYYNVGGHAFDLFGWVLSGPQAEMIAKIGNMVVVFFAVLVFTWLARTLRRQQLTYVFAAFCFVGLLMYRAMLPDAGEATVWSFYIFGDLYNSLMVATFFAFLNDSVSPLDARRLYGPIILGGVTGGAFSSFFVRTQIENFEPADWALICAGIMIAVAAIAAAAGRWVDRRGAPTTVEVPNGVEPAKRSALACEGGRLVLRSPYLLAIVGLVGIPVHRDGGALRDRRHRPTLCDCLHHHQCRRAPGTALRDRQRHESVRSQDCPARDARADPRGVRPIPADADPVDRQLAQHG